MKYPQAPRTDVVETLHGVRIEDPYRVLEDSHDPRTRAWIEEENRLTESYLSRIPARKAIRTRLEALMNYPRESVIWREGGRYYVLKNTGLENQDRLYSRPTPRGPDTEVINPNLLSPDGTTAMVLFTASPDDQRLAYGVSKGGSDWNEIFVRDLSTGRDLGDHLKWCKFTTISWAKDSTGFYYSRYDAPAAGAELSGVNRFQKLYFHKIGDKQEQDRLVFERPDDGEVGSMGRVSHDGRYLVISCWRGSSRLNEVYYIDLEAGDGKAHPIVPKMEATYDWVGNVGKRFFFVTSKDANLKKLIEVDCEQGLASLKTVIPESNHTLQVAALLKGHFVCQYMVDAANELKIFDLTGRYVKDVPVPGVGVVVTNFYRRHDDEEAFFGFENLTTPLTTYRFTVPGAQVELIHKPKAPFDSDQFETKRVFYQSKDGTRIPLFIAGKKGIRQDGQNAVLLYGYGGFNNPVLPWFRTSRIAWMESGHLYASACLRGGGEYGDEWHNAGRLDKKQNVFDDFIAASEYLTREKYTTSSKLAINGGSNGGLLMGACMIQRPDLFGAVVAGVGVFDMLRFHKFTIGWAWVSDYGSPDDPVHFRNLLSYSPLHTLKPGTKYPPVLLTTGDHDDRVVPAHSFKFAAALQAAQAGPAPILIRIDTQTGHGMGKPVGKLLDETADIFAFLNQALGL
jgi:prolyl oligopeptidase